MPEYLINLSGTQVLEIIAPADPDSLQEMNPGVWTAKWSPLGVPSLERFTINTHDRLEIVKNWYTPFVGWTAIDFRILPDSGVDHG